ncbi:heavy-metal-associated domain-containing protein [Candidatus Poribacteria bacterium]|nr:heavy-metal-associated domain-containing protein [Candidatus Poribacteria bacterium]
MRSTQWFRVGALSIALAMIGLLLLVSDTHAIWPFGKKHHKAAKTTQAKLAKAEAGVINYKVGIEGMTCRGCESPAKSALTGVSGVDAVTVDWKQGAQITTQKGKTLPLTKLQQAIAEKGFTPKGIEMTAIGQIVDWKNGRKAFKVNGTDQTLVLLENEPLEKLEGITAQGAEAITLTGMVSLYKGDAYLLIGGYEISGEKPKTSHQSSSTH